MAISPGKIKQFLNKVLSVSDVNLQQQSGGCINECFKVDAGNKKYFCKINSASKFPQLFEAEAKGLELIKKCKTFKTPEVLNIFYEEDYQLLLLEWIEEGERTSKFWRKFGHALAELHSISNNKYGLDIINYMGIVPQINTLHDKWISFFIEQRLQPLIALCKEKNFLTPVHENSFHNCFNKFPEFFINVKPVLVHGDLWSGNFMCNKNEEPVLVDPAVYFGIPAVDLGMSQLFGGFDSLFYQSYQYHSRIASNQNQQNRICNLYPLLIHLFLFGKSYLPQIEETIIEFK